jgi:hypothetical protein
MKIRNILSFGSNADRLKIETSRLANQVRAISRYIQDTKSRPGQADYDLLFAAEMLEHGARQAVESARELRSLHARIEQQRADLSNPRLIAAE